MPAVTLDFCLSHFHSQTLSSLPPGPPHWSGIEGGMRLPPHPHSVPGIPPKKSLARLGIPHGSIPHAPCRSQCNSQVHPTMRLLPYISLALSALSLSGQNPHQCPTSSAHPSPGPLLHPSHDPAALALRCLDRAAPSWKPHEP